MSKTIYYLGAGASYGRRGEDKKIIDGIPVVSEITEQFALFRAYIETAVIPSDCEMVFQNTYRQSASNIESERRDMLYDIDQLIKGIQEHATIDTYARKLYLTGRERKFKKLKSVLCAFFVWAQLVYKPDGRYDTFLANVLEEGNLMLPKEISIVSWNYDSQIENAYRAYHHNSKLPLFEKNIQGESLLVLLILLNNMPKYGLRTKIMRFANKMSESIIAERLYWCSRNTILFANCSQNKEKGTTFLM